MLAKSSATSSSPIAVFSVFSGARFVDLGLTSAGFKIAIAKEVNVESVDGYHHPRSIMDLPLPRIGISCDPIAEQFMPTGVTAIRKLVYEEGKSGQKADFIGGPPHLNLSADTKDHRHTAKHSKPSHFCSALVRMF